MQNPRRRMQVALLESSVFMSTSNEMWWLFCSYIHTMKLHYALVKLKRYLLHMRVYDYRTREIKSVVYGRNAENELVSRIKNGRLP